MNNDSAPQPEEISTPSQQEIPNDVPAAEAPASDAPAGEAPSDAPAAETPTSDAPASDAPASDAPAAEAPPSDAPAEAPSEPPAGAPLAPPVPSAIPRPAKRPAPADGGAERRPDTPSPSEQFGRFDHDGNIFVTLPDGNEHFVGQWATGDPTEGLRLYAHRFDDLVVDVDLAGRRLTEGRMSPDDAQRTVDRIREALLDPKVVGNLADLAARVRQLEVAVEVRRETLVEERQAAKAAAEKRRRELVEKAEGLANSTQWRSTNDKFRAIVDEWKAIPRHDRALEQELWKQISAARSTFDRARRSHFHSLEKEHQQAKAAKKSLVDEAQALSTSTDWGPTAAAYRELMERWKKAGFAGKPDDDKLWRAFRGAQDEFFAARKAALDERDTLWTTNLEQKKKIVEQAQALLPVSDPVKARKAFRALQGEFAAIGHVPRADKPKLDAAMAKVEDAIRSSEQDQWRRSDPERNARAADLVSKYEDSVAAIEAKLATAQAQGADTADLEATLASQRALLEAARKYV